MRRNLNTNTKAMPTLLCVAVLFLMVGPSAAEPTVEWIGSHYPWAVNADGTAVAGNTGSTLSAFRWTAESGVVDLGMSTSVVLGQGAGTPDISDDGNHISATIISPDSLYATQGIWTKGIGWQRSMPPVPVDGGIIDNSLGSAWGLSGDGTTVTGFYWRPGQAATGLAHTNIWSTVDGFTALTSPLRNCRGNDANYDGSVVAGWSERMDGVWCPTVWDDGVPTVLHNQGLSTTAEGVSNDGNTVWGTALDTTSGVQSATIWVRNGSTWDEFILGALPGTFPGSGNSVCFGRSEDGSIIVGYNTFDGSPFNTSGFVWTLAEGIVKANDFFAAAGVVFPTNFNVDILTDVSNNGRSFVGFGHVVGVFPQVDEGFVITLDAPAGVPEMVMNNGVAIEANHPNPFNPSTTITLAIDRSQDVAVEIFDARGRLVRSLPQGVLESGRHQVVWNGKNDAGRGQASGLYFARARNAQGVSQPHRMMLVK